MFTKQSQDLGRDGMSPDSLGLDISSLYVSVSLQNTAHGKAAAQHEKSLDWRGNPGVIYPIWAQEHTVIEADLQAPGLPSGCKVFP